MHRHVLRPLLRGDEALGAEHLGVAEQRHGTYRIVAVVVSDDFAQEARQQLRIVARNVVVVDLGHSAVGDLHGHEPEDGLAFPRDEPRMRTRGPERIVVVLAQHAASHDQRSDECIKAGRSAVQFLDCHIRKVIKRPNVIHL